MKAYSYLQLSIMQHNDQVSNGYMDEMERISGGKAPDEFFTQQFKPELITELFEGWYLEDDDKCRYYCQTNIGGVYAHVSGSGYFDIILDGRVYPHPRTLDDFITDCQRSGIELEWKTNL